MPGALLAEQDFTALKTSLSPIITTAIFDMIVQGTHTQAPHLQLLWLAQRLQSHAQEMLRDSSPAMAPAAASSVFSAVSTVSANIHEPRNISQSSVETKYPAVLRSSTIASGTTSNSREHTAAEVHKIAPDVTCECTCDKILLPGMRSGDASIPAGCTGVCGLAHVSHDMWALGVILYRLCARESLWSEDDEDNVKDASGHLLELALWTDAFKEERLQ